jgi:two-component system, sensor histidine kinase and response regulator
LGLAISKQLARLMQGDVGVHSSPGQGATFWFTARLQVASAAELQQGGETIGPALAGPRAGVRVLLAEDNPINQQVAQEILEDFGAVVTVVADGAQAVALLSAPHHFDLVLMDMQMPVMDGLEATRRIRALPGLAHLPVLAMTANAMPSATEECLQAGMNDHLSKPIDPQALGRALARWARGAGHAGSSGSSEPPLPENTDPSDAQWLALQSIEGLDTAMGVRNVLRRDLYLKLLAQFARAERDFGQRLAAALASADGPLALRLTHTLKGVAATLGATPLAEQAGQLETLLQVTAPTQVEVQVAAQVLQAQLCPLLQALDEVVVPYPSNAPAVNTVSAPDARHLLRQIAALARESDASAMELLQEHREVLEKNWPQATRHAAELLQNYDFPEAALVLEAALTGVG